MAKLLPMFLPQLLPPAEEARAGSKTGQVLTDLAVFELGMGRALAVSQV